MWREINFMWNHITYLKIMREIILMVHNLATLIYQEYNIYGLPMLQGYLWRIRRIIAINLTDT